MVTPSWLETLHLLLLYFRISHNTLNCCLVSLKMHIPKSIGRGGEEGEGEVGAEQIVLWEFENSHLRVELCPVTNQVAFYSAHVRPNGNKLDFQNVSSQNESGVYQCVAENPHGMIVSYTAVRVRGKHLENCVYNLTSSPITKLDFFFILSWINFWLKKSLPFSLWKFYKQFAAVSNLPIASKTRDFPDNVHVKTTNRLDSLFTN